MSDLSQRIVCFRYKNHRGEVAWRTVLPGTIWFGTSPFHECDQWFLRGIDSEKGERDFALKDITEWRDAQ